MNVTLLQWPYGAFAFGRSPCHGQPGTDAVLILVEVWSMKVSPDELIRC